MGPLHRRFYLFALCAMAALGGLSHWVFSPQPAHGAYSTEIRLGPAAISSPAPDLNWDSESHGPLAVEVPGLEAAVAAPSTLDSERVLTVELAPTATARLQVVDEAGEPFAGVVVRIRPIPMGTHPVIEANHDVDESAWVQATITDYGGIAEAALSTRAIAELDSPGGARAQVLVVPAATTQVTLHRRSARVLVVDAATDEPLPAFHATLEDSRQPAARPVPVTSDQEGAISVPAGTRGIVLSLTDARRVSARADWNPRVIGVGEGMFFRLDDLELHDTITIRVDIGGVSLRLVDAKTRLPIEGAATVVHEHRRKDAQTGDLAWSFFTSLTRTVSLRSGVLHLRQAFLHTDDRTRIRVEVDGYLRETLDHTDLVPGREARVVEMERGGRAVAVTIRHVDGAPAQGHFALVDKASGERQRESVLGPSGAVTLKHWSGGDIGVVRMVYGYRLLQSRTVLGTVPAAAVRGGRAVFVLPSPGVRGRITVSGAPGSAPPIFALDSLGISHRGVRNGADFEFDGLAPGRYFVGTRGWLDGLTSQYSIPNDESPVALVSTVEEGVETQVLWDSRWATMSPVTGRVIADADGLATLALRPWYGLSSGNLEAFDDLRIYLDPDGRYTIPAGAPLPERLLVCPTNESYWVQVLQSFRPGEDAEVLLGGLTVRWEGEPPLGGTAMVLYKASGLVFDAPFAESRAKGYYCQWNTAEPLTFDTVSTSVKYIEVEVESDGKKRARFPVEVYQGRTATVTVSLGALAD